MTAERMRYCGTVGDARAVLQEWSAVFPQAGVLALLPEGEKDNLPRLQAACRECGVPLVGGVFPALIVAGEFAERGVWLLRLDAMPFWALLPALNEGEAEAADRIAAAVSDRLQGTATLLLLFDAMVPNIATILDGLYLQLADRVRYMGANAGSESFQPMPCLFDGESLVQDGVLLLLLPDHPGAILEHGYRAPEQMTVATATEGNRVRTIDWRPAFEVYREIVRAQYGVEVNRENFYQYAIHFPFGIVRANDEIIVRIPVALEEDGSLFCVGEVPPNAMLTLLQAPEVDSRSTVNKLAAGLEALNGPMAGRELLTFYCAGRRLHIGDAAKDELKELESLSGADVMAGALSLGEIGSSTQWGYPLFHNATLVCCAWGGQ